MACICQLYVFGNTGSPAGEAIKLYNKADRLFNLSNPTDETDRISLETFQLVINIAKKNNVVSDSILFQCYFKKGILYEVSGNYDEARQSYLYSMGFIKPMQNDSLAYQVYVYTGTVYYNLNNYDSAHFYLLEAEKMIRRCPNVTGKERLYNALGALYYENGNYLQSRNYFSRAYDVIISRKPVDRASAMNFENNIAASCLQLGLYDEAITRYKKILGYAYYRDQTKHNLGKALAAKGDLQPALTYFRNTNKVQIPGVLNEIARIHFQLNNLDSAQYYLNMLKTVKFKNNSRLKDVDIGINYLYQSDLDFAAGRYEQALASIQQSIILFSGNFSNADVLTNPTGFSGLFASYRLFDALFKKAIIFEAVYKKSGKEESLLAAHHTYTSAIALLRYIEKNYDTDDAKIFLKQHSNKVFDYSLQVCLRLHRLHPASGFLEKAFLTGEKNKSSIMAAGLQEKWFKKTSGVDGHLLQTERNLKYNIARLNIKMEKAFEKSEMEVIEKEKNRLEVELSMLQKQLEQNSSYYQLKYEESYPGLKEIQQYLNHNQAVISFYGSSSGMHVFVISNTSFRYALIDSLPELENNVQDWIIKLKQLETGRKFKPGGTADRLYRQLIQPVQAMAGEKNQWIIIPDKILNLLPFESLPAGNEGKLLLETTEISYQASARFIVPRKKTAHNPTSFSVLGFAPFALKGQTVNYPEFKELYRLPSSLEEINKLPGKRFIDGAATKRNFLNELTHYSIVHLATHAVSNNNNPAGSYITFYPAQKEQSEDCLYLEELYCINMDNIDLVVLSACETGDGKLVNTEGVISLSRGFLYAGCNGTINSLWKADDKTTAAILQHFYSYLEKGYTKSKALQLAKLEYIKSDAINKSPQYWSHLVLTGDPGPLVRKNNHYRYGYIAGIVVIIAVTIGLRSKRYKK